MRVMRAGAAGELTPACRKATRIATSATNAAAPRATEMTGPAGVRGIALAGTDRTCGSSLRMAPRSVGQWSAGEDEGRKGSVAASTVVAIWASCKADIGKASVPCRGAGSTSVASVFVGARRSSGSGLVAVPGAVDVVAGKGPSVGGDIPIIVVCGKRVGGTDDDGDGGCASSGDGRDSGARTADAVARFSVVSWCAVL